MNVKEAEFLSSQMTKVFLEVFWYLFLTAVEVKKGTRDELQRLLHEQNTCRTVKISCKWEHLFCKDGASRSVR